MTGLARLRAPMPNRRPAAAAFARDGRPCNITAVAFRCCAKCISLPVGIQEANPMSTSAWIVVGVIVVLALWIVTVYNGLVAMRQRVGQAFADIDVQLKQRHDLIPNLVETVKGYAAHERGTLEAVVQARNTAMAAQGPAQQAAAENMLSGALRQLFALSEAYPNLKANTNFQELQAELTDIENKLAASRRFFNNSVQEYNTGIQQFPAALFAGIFGFTPREFFDVGEERKTLDQAPQVKF
jgi:LemA protein